MSAMLFGTPIALNCLPPPSPPLKLLLRKVSPSVSLSEGGRQIKLDSGDVDVRPGEWGRRKRFTSLDVSAAAAAVMGSN